MRSAYERLDLDEHNSAPKQWASAYRFDKEIHLETATVADGHPARHATFHRPSFLWAAEIKPGQRVGGRVAFRARPRFGEVAAYSFWQSTPFLQLPVPPRRFHVFPWQSPLRLILGKTIRVHRPIIEDESAVRFQRVTIGRHQFTFVIAVQFVA